MRLDALDFFLPNAFLASAAVDFAINSLDARRATARSLEDAIRGAIERRGSREKRAAAAALAGSRRRSLTNTRRLCRFAVLCFSVVPYSLPEGFSVFTLDVLRNFEG